MKTLIIGTKGIGKTKLIIEEIIPTLDKYLILDFCQQYTMFEENKKVVFYPTIVRTKEYGVKALHKEVIKIIRDTPDDVTLILDELSVVGNKLGWLKKETENKNVVIVLQSTSAIKSKCIPDYFDEIYAFDTMDSEEIKLGYLNQQITKEVKVHFRGVKISIGIKIEI